MRPEVKRLLRHWGVAAAVVLLLVVLNGFGLGIPCPVYHFTGLYCPGCGSMRAVASLARFNLPAAWGFNPLVVLALPLLAVLVLLQFLHAARGTRPQPKPWHRYAAIALIVLFVGFGILRNLPAFHFLAPIA